MFRLVIPLVMFSIVTSNAQQWTFLNSTTTAKLNDVYFINKDTGWVCGDSGLVLKTLDGGTTWTRTVTDPSIKNYAIHFYNLNLGIISGSISSIYKTTNAGASWVLKNLNPDSTLYDIKFIDSMDIIAVGESGKILLSTDQGNTWNKLTVPTTKDLVSITAFDQNYIWIGGTDIILITTDLGASWTYFTSVFKNNLFFIINKNLIWRTAWKWRDGYPPDPPSYYFFVSTDQGNNWSEKYNHVGNMSCPIYFDSLGQKGYIHDGYGEILVTTNGGEQWTVEQSYYLHRLYGMHFLDFNTGYIVGENGWIIKKAIVNDINPEINNLPSFNLFQNYPNPFNPSTKIKYMVPSDIFVKVSVYNVLGEKITDLVNEHVKAGSYEINFDAGNLSSGIYFYKIEAGNFGQVKKMSIVK